VAPVGAARMTTPQSNTECLTHTQPPTIDGMMCEVNDLAVFQQSLKRHHAKRRRRGRTVPISAAAKGWFLHVARS